MFRKLKKKLSIALTLSMVFTMGVCPVSAATLDESESGEMSIMNEPDEKTGNPIQLGEWSASDADGNTELRLHRGLNGDGNEIFILYAGTNDSNNECDNWKTTISGNANSPLLMIQQNGYEKFDSGDSITLDVDMKNATNSDPVYIMIYKPFFADFSEALRDTVINVVPHKGTVCTKTTYQANNYEPERWVYIFSPTNLKKCSVGGWTVSDKNVAGNATSFVYGGENYDNWADHWAAVVSPTSEGKAIDTVVKGSLNSEHLDLFMILDHEPGISEDYTNACRVLTPGTDHILIDVENDVNDDWVQVGMPLENFKPGSKVEDIMKIVEIKEEPGVVYEAGIDDDGGDNYFYINFEKTTEQEKIDLVIKDREKDTDSTTERTQVFGDTIPVNGQKEGKKWVFSVKGLKEKKGEQKLTVNAGVKFVAEDLKDLDMSKVTLSFNKADGTTVEGTDKDVKKHLKINKKGEVSVKKDKKYSSYVLMMPLSECTLYLTVVNIDFDKKALKDKKITALTGEGSTLSVNLVQMAGKEAGEDSEFMSADWTVDGKTEVKTTDSTKPEKSKKGLNVYLSPDFQTIMISNPGDVKKGSVKITANINGKKYTAKIKLKIK